MSIRESRLANKTWKALHLILYKIGLRQHMRAHRSILERHLLEVLDTTPQPVIIETGCIRDANEGTESTLAISSVLMGRGDFYTFEISSEHIRVCQELCKDYNQYINYVEGDSVVNLTGMVEAHVFEEIHFALFDSVNDGNHIWKEFKAVENLFGENAIIIVDDVLWGDKGRLLKPYLEASSEWRTKVYNVEYGILAAKKTVES